MLRHHHYECSRPRFFKCSYCEQLAKQKGVLQHHLSRVHPELPPKWEIVYAGD